MEQTKTATRDYRSYSDTPWGLWEVLYARRSHRKYLPGDYTQAFFGSLEETVDLALSTRGAVEGSVMVVTDPGKVERIKKRIHKGTQGKINLWLNRSPVAGFLALAVAREDVRSERPRELPLAAMAVEDVVLWLTEAGQGTCWLGGLNQKEVGTALGLGRETYVSAVIPFGKPKPRVKAMDMDHMLYRQISRKRKPLSDIAYLETMDNPYSVRELSREPFSAPAVQDVAGLLRQLGEKRESDPGVPLDLALDACFEAARIAPSAGNTQQWHFIGVRREDTLEKLARACGVDVAWQAAVVGVADPDRSYLYEMLEKPFWMIDVPIALSQMSLMAVSMGFGVDVCVDGVDEAGINGLVGLEPPLRTVGVLGLR
ncbi:MAG: nitroreductase family protein [Actinomycetota bacterium]|nr:nitroreductase family protein [Actinomycetota bacterium]